MASAPEIVTVTVLAAPSTPCSGKMTWEMATAFLRERLNRRFGSQVTVHYVELFSPESFAFPAVLEGIQQEKHQLPIVLVNGSIVSDGAKLNEGVISRYVRECLQKNSQ
jgi:disulfide oxidoreductase YuzD